jgi:demethylmenaquinone methyltransferase/2-methoxy-6-polyprenyl-1,4-benzoquinol methylase
MTSNDGINSPIEEAATIQRMFNAIAPTYDTLNHLLSFGCDIRWRKTAVGLVAGKAGGSFLDLACGSGDLSLEALRLRPSKIIATDFAANMLDVFRHKLNKINPAVPIELLAADVHALPFPAGSFDVTMVAFGIRNFADRLQSLREMHRVLKPTGIALILELSAPTAPIVKQAYFIYGRVLLPLIGKIISRHNKAYSYLPASIAQFPDSGEFLGLMSAAGFIDVRAVPLTFGAATIFLGTKT